MSKKPMLVRCLLILSFMPSLLIVLYGYRREKNRQAIDRYYAEEQLALSRHYAECYSKITLFMPEFKVESLLEGRGFDVEDPGWPTMVGDLPEYETEIRKQTIKVGRR